MTTETNKANPIPLPSADDHPAAKMPRAQSTQAKDAVALLTADHSKIKQLFSEYDRVQRLGDVELKADLAQQIALEAQIHATLKEELFYPAVRGELADAKVLQQAIQGQAEANELVARLHGLPGDDPDLDSNVQLLHDAVTRHIQHEESQLFPLVRQGGLDLLGLYEQLAERKEQLEHDLGSSPLRTGRHEATGERNAVGKADS